MSSGKGPSPYHRSSEDLQRAGQQTTSRAGDPKQETVQPEAPVQPKDNVIKLGAGKTFIHEHH